MADRVDALAPEGVTTIAAPVDGITPANRADAADVIDEAAGLGAAGRLWVPIAASFPIQQIRAAHRRRIRGSHVPEPQVLPATHLRVAAATSEASPPLTSMTRFEVTRLYAHPRP